MKNIVVYYSLTGNTRQIAKDIAKKLKCKIVEIKTIKEYPSDYDELRAVGKQESIDKVEPEIKPLEVDFSKYDNIIIGSPVWRYTYAPAVRTFLHSYKDQFKYKRLFPFATYDKQLGHIFEDINRENVRTSIVKIGFEFQYEEDSSTLITPLQDVDKFIEYINL